MNKIMNNKGSIIYSAMMVLVLSSLAAAIMVRSINENKAAKRVSNATEAFWVAEAGVQKTVYELNYNNCTSFVQQNTSTHCTTCSDCGAGNKTLAISVSGSCDYDVVMNNGNTTLTSTGTCPNRSSTNKVMRNVQTSIGTVSPFAYAAFAKGQVTLNNNTYIDSYDSSVGAYNISTNSSTNGDVGSNGTTAGVVSIGGNVTLGGDVSTGVGGTVTQDNGSVVTGTVTHTNNVSIPSMVVPSALTGLAGGTALSFSNNETKTLTAGDYKYTALDMTANGTTLNITGGQVRLYLTAANALTSKNNNTINVASGATLQIFVDGVLNVDNNVTLTSSNNRPQNFQIYSTYTGSNGITFNNNGKLYTSIYSPGTDVNIGNQEDVYGSVIGKTVLISNNAAIHYDETLRTLSTPAGATGITQWKEI